MGDFINCENTVTSLDYSKIKLGQGIYVANHEEIDSLPSFMYPVFIDNSLEYVYRIFDDGTGNYTGNNNSNTP